MRASLGRVFLIAGLRFHRFKYIVPFPLSRRVFAESQLIAMGVPLFTAGCFSVGAFNILSSSLTSADLIPRCLGIVLFGLFLIGTQCFLDLDVCFSSQVGEVSSCYVFSVLWPLSLFLLLGLL